MAISNALMWWRERDKHEGKECYGLERRERHEREVREGGERGEGER